MGDPFLGLAAISFRRHRFGPMCPTEGQLQRFAALAVRFCQMPVTTIGVNLDGAVEAHQDCIGIFAFSAGMVVEHDARRSGAIPAPVIAHNGPEIACFRLTQLLLAPPRIKDRSRGLNDTEP